MGLTVLPPDVNEGEYAFAALPDGRIRYGLGAVKGVGRAAAEAIAEERARGGPYADLADLTQRIDPNKLGKRVLEALTSAGALDALGANRASVWQTLSEAMRAADQHVRDREAGQQGLFGGAVEGRVPVTPARVPDWPMAQKLAGERDTLGHYLSGHPTDACRDWLAQFTGASIGKADSLYKAPPDGNEWRARGDANAVVLAGVVAELRRRNDQMAFAVLEDWSGRIEVSFFREAMAQYGSLLSKDALLVVEGWLQLDEFSGGMAFRAKRALTLEQACERAARVVTLRVRDAAPDCPRRLAAALSAHRPGKPRSAWSTAAPPARPAWTWASPGACARRPRWSKPCAAWRRSRPSSSSWVASRAPPSRRAARPSSGRWPDASFRLGATAGILRGRGSNAATWAAMPAR
jgi:DNA polymerase-3 subunit alpha